MNAAVQRRLTPWLLAMAAASGALLLAFWFGLGGGIRWNPPRPAAALPPVHRAPPLPPPPPLDGYAAVWQHPLFSADRKPSLSGGSKASQGLGDLQLSGVILTPSLHMALLHDKTGDVAIRVREGEAVPDTGWTLLQLKSRSAVFASASGRSELDLPVTAPDPLKPPPGGTQPNNGAPPNQPPDDGQSVQPQPGAATMRVIPPAGATVGGNAPPADDSAGGIRSRLEALKAAVQRRRAAQQQVAPSNDNDVPKRDR